MAANNMLPILLAAGAAFFLMGRKGGDAGEGEGEGEGEGGGEAGLGSAGVSGAAAVSAEKLQALRDNVFTRRQAGQLPPEQVPQNQRGEYLLEDAIETTAQFFPPFPDNKTAAISEVRDDPEGAAIWAAVMGVYRELFPSVTIPALFVTLAPAST
jgi:hypothetical protein